MKRKGIINAQLAGLIAGLGHKDTYMIADAGMPIPRGVEIVDLALVGGVPTFRQVTDAVLEEAGVERYTLAKEIREANPDLLSYLQEKLDGIEHSYVAHEELKKLEHDCKFVIRTGEFTPYPNVILQAAVAF
jgi:D-ribose pyranase